MTGVTWQEFRADSEVIQHLSSTLFRPRHQALCQKRRLVALFDYVQQARQHVYAHHRWLRKHVGLILLVQTAAPGTSGNFGTFWKVCSSFCTWVCTGSGLYRGSDAPCSTERRSSWGRQLSSSSRVPGSSQHSSSSRSNKTCKALLTCIM